MGHEHIWEGGMSSFPWLFFLVMMLICFFLFFRRGARRYWWGWGDSSDMSCWGRPESALEILKKRFARGDISTEEYEKLKKEILS